MNVELLERVKAHILEQPNRLIMSSEILTLPEESDEGIEDALNGFDSLEKIHVYPPCGTAACIAGWACILSHPEMTPKQVDYNFFIEQEAEQQLDVSYDQLCKLYYSTNWPEPFKSNFATEDIKKRAEVAAARIDHFIATGE